MQPEARTDDEPIRPEMPRPFAVARIDAGVKVDVVAQPDECVALARRMGVLGIRSLSCTFHLCRADAGAVQARGELRAHVTQTCVVTLEPFESELSEDFAVRFVPAGTESEEVDLEADDEIGYVGGVLDLGEAASEQLALALDPFPRKPGAALDDQASPEQQGAFAALSRLRPPSRPSQDTPED
jgi:hypothetical protein